MVTVAIVSPSLFKQQFLQTALRQVGGIEANVAFSNWEEAIVTVDAFLYAPCDEWEQIDVMGLPRHTVFVLERHQQVVDSERTVFWQTANAKALTKDLAAKLLPCGKRDEAPLQPLGEVVAIGASSGGPLALTHVLTKLAPDFSAPVVIAQHMPAGFTKSLAARLDRLCRIRVKEASHGEALLGGTAYIAPGGAQLELNKRGARLYAHISPAGKHDLYHPSVSLLFQSTIACATKTLVVLTGMGNDGSKVLEMVKQSGGCEILAESEKSAAIFGMPKAAIASNQVDVVMDKDEIGRYLAKKDKREGGFYA
ncbi:CheB methylesterase domain-containing protein [Shouchella clausii]|uniref:CheB methylesterase domain-containing protein n=1 Tax=Shouchella clausii TaxID=79880 RepID=UPI002148B5C6|nr:CheB methylesterase domain-containing protein [Shouchella clausii]MCR1286257.1 CheB methylesterase domain-containing protein [Shouchella clausii]